MATYPAIQTYHCLCTSLLFVSTHKLSSLPRRQGTSLDNALILPIPSTPPNANLSPSRSPEAESESEDEVPPGPQSEIQQRRRLGREMETEIPSEGYTLLLSMALDRNWTIIRRDDGFEKRLLWRCGRCRLVVGYELQGNERGGESTDLDGKEKAPQEKLKVVYLLPAGIMSTEIMMGKGRHIDEEDVELLNQGRTTIPAFE